MELTAQNVQEVLTDCLWKDDEQAEMWDQDLHSRATIVQGVVNFFGFNPERLESHRMDISGLLAQLPDGFKKSGGGWSFLNGCVAKDGRQWGEQIDVEALMCLGLALNLVEYQLPRELWSVLPGGVPYFVILD